MTTVIIAVQFTKSDGQPATGEALADIDISLSSVAKADLTVTPIWATENPTVELGQGKYAKLYTLADFATNDYIVQGQYTGATVMDNDYVYGDTAFDDATIAAIAALNDPTADEIADEVQTRTIAAVTTVTNLTNAPTSGDLTTTMKASVNTEMDAALVDIQLDHLMAVTDAGTMVNDSIIAKMAASDGVWAGYDKTTDALEAIRDRGDAAWTTGAGGVLGQIIKPSFLVPISIDLANTASVRLGILLTNAVDDLPTGVEITPGTISIWRKAKGGTAWTAIVGSAAMSEADGIVYYDEVFDSATGYAEGDSIMFQFEDVSITADANTFNVTPSTGARFQTYIRKDISSSEAQAAAAAALVAYDPPTRAESTADTSSVLSAISGLNDLSVSDVLTTQMTEAYAADGVAPTLAQALFMIQQQLGDFSIVGTTLTVRKLDGATTAATFTLNSTTPTGVTRAS